MHKSSFLFNWWDIENTRQWVTWILISREGKKQSIAGLCVCVDLILAVDSTRFLKHLLCAEMR